MRGGIGAVLAVVCAVAAFAAVAAPTPAPKKAQPQPAVKPAQPKKVQPKKRKQPHVERIRVEANQWRNKTVDFWVHRPTRYNAAATNRYPVLVYFGGRNNKGKELALGKHGWTRWADRNGVFLICPGYQDNDYWHPKKWSGDVLLAALAELNRRYPNADVEKVGYYGYSAGAKAANLFAAWRPDRCRAWAGYAAMEFHEPSASMRGIPALLMCGDADPVHAILSREFIAKSRAKGVDVLWKSYPNEVHAVADDSLRLAYEFMSAYLVRREPLQSYRYIGDDEESVYYPRDAAEASFIPRERVVLLPDRKFADAWGREGRAARVARRAMPLRRPSAASGASGR